eukprot:gene4882-34647_t
MDPTLEDHKRKMITEAGRQLKEAKMAVFDEGSGNFYVSELGRVASHYYIRHQSMVIFNTMLKPHLTESDLLTMVSQSSEFESVQIRDEELSELDDLLRNGCQNDVKGGIENKPGKVNVLMQNDVNGGIENKPGKVNVLMQNDVNGGIESKPGKANVLMQMESFSLIADMMYASSNAPRIMRAIFEICLRLKWSSAAIICLNMCKCFERRLWQNQHPLRQFEGVLSYELLNKLEERDWSLDALWDMSASEIGAAEDMSASEIGAAVRYSLAGGQIRSCVEAFPFLELDALLQPITRTVLRVQLLIRPSFKWMDKVHGGSLRWLILVEDSETEKIYHSELWILTKKMMFEEEHKVAFTIPIFEPLPSMYIIRAISEDWIGAEAVHTISFNSLILPERMPPNTELLDLDPLPLSVLRNPQYEDMYRGRFTHFNPIQTQAFHTLYHTDENVLLGAPTGSGKTISSELTMLRLFNAHPGSKVIDIVPMKALVIYIAPMKALVIYIAPMKALVRERIEDWTKGLCKRLNKKMCELTADIIICTPEKWDGISRNWQTRSYVKKVGLLVIDEIHLLGADRGPILEVIVARMRYIAEQTNRSVRFVGLSTAIANAQDLADWLGIGSAGLFNFKPSVRPVPLEAHIQGYPGKFYCPRMMTMNKPSYAAIQMHSPRKPVLIFVSSRRQTRLTAQDLITYAVADERPHQFVHMDGDELQQVAMTVKDAELRNVLQFGIGLHHAGLNDRDRSTVERLFVQCKIQVLVATSTLAWGVNTPAHLVIVKGTEFFDAPTRRYVDFPITDVLQMMGRAGRPQYDHHGVAVIMVHEPKKQFYKRFLYEPLPVESSLHTQLWDHFNAEIVSGTIRCKQDAMDYLTWTYFYRRLVQNPSYYDLVEDTLADLEEAGCVVLGMGEDGGAGEADAVDATPTGRICSFYYLKYTTMTHFTQNLGPDLELSDLLSVLCMASEYDELPVRHNEDKINTAMASTVRLPVDAHFSRQLLPIRDYIGDTKTVLDNSGSDELAAELAKLNIDCLPQLMEGLGLIPSQTTNSASLAKRRTAVMDVMYSVLGDKEAREAIQVAERLPAVSISWKAVPDEPEGGGLSKEEASAYGWRVEINVQRQAGSKAAGHRAALAAEAADQGGGSFAGGPVSSKGRPRVYAPLFPKVKEEGWYMVLGDPHTHDLLALKRISIENQTTIKMDAPRFNGAGKKLAEVTLYLMSDSYLGMDQQYTIQLSQ